MLKSIVPALLIAGAAMSAQAADGDKLLGFEFGVGFHLVDDSRYEGTDVNFGLVLPVGQKFDVVVYHEVASFRGSDTDDNDRSNVHSDINELRFRLSAWESEAMAVKIFLGMGFAEQNEDESGTEWGSTVADIGINFTALKSKSGPVKGELAINAFYRYNKFEAQGLNLDDDLTKLGGFVIGLTAGLYF
jgi:hypothetical protein